MRAAAEIDEFPRGVERHHRLDGLFLDQLAFEFLVALAIQLERLRLGDQLALVRDVLRGNLAHPGLDLFEVFGRERLVAQKFVEEAGFDRRADAELHVGIKLEDGGGEQMRGRVAEHLHRVGILGRQDRELDVVVEREREIDKLAIGARDQRIFREARADLAGDLRGGGAAEHFARRAIRQRDLNVRHVVFSGCKAGPQGILD